MPEKKHTQILEAVGAPPEGWSVEREVRGTGTDARLITFYVARTGKKLRSMNEVHHFLKVNPSITGPRTIHALIVTRCTRHAQPRSFKIVFTLPRLLERLG